MLQVVKPCEFLAHRLDELHCVKSKFVIGTIAVWKAARLNQKPEQLHITMD